MNKPTTSENLPNALRGMVIKERTDFEKLPNEPLVAGKSVVVNSVGRLYLYMGDDQRQSPPQQIIVNDWNGNLAFLGIESKVAIALKYNLS